MRRLAIRTSLVLAAISVGCAADLPTTVELGGQLLAANAGSSLLGSVVPGDFTDPAATALASTCPTVVKVGQWHLNFGHTQCLVVQPDWNTSSGFEPYTLTDDIKLIVIKEQGKNGQITHVRFRGQDLIGDAGIAHESDVIPVAEPVVPSKSGFTLHVHAPSVAIWRLSGHTGGERVALIGWVSIGDLVYQSQ